MASFRPLRLESTPLQLLIWKRAQTVKSRETYLELGKLARLHVFAASAAA